MSGSAGHRLIPTNTTLLQPISRFFRLSDSLSYQAGVNSAIQVQNGSLNNVITTIQGQIATLQGQVATLNGEVASLNTTVASLQSQIDTINSRLASAGIP